MRWSRTIAVHVVFVTGIAASACEDLDTFTTTEGQIYAGEVVDASIVRAGFEAGTRLHMTFDVALADEGPGAITVFGPDEGTEPVYFDNAPLLPITSMRNDSLGGFDFPSGRLKNFMFFATASGDFEGELALVVVSLLSDGDVEARIILGSNDLYGIFLLDKTSL
jgi:hypothetical protein